MRELLSGGRLLMLRICNWKDLVFYRPTPDATYGHLNALFGAPIDCRLIETHWQDLLQVVISVRQRRVIPSTILRRLGNYSRKNRLYQVFRELGRAMGACFLLRYTLDHPLYKTRLKRCSMGDGTTNQAGVPPDGGRGGMPRPTRA